MDARARRTLLYPEGMRLGFLGGLCLIAACSSAKSGGGAGGFRRRGTSATGTGPARWARSTSSESVLERGKSPQRTAHFIQPALTTAAAVTKMALDTTFAATFSGAVAGVPLFAAGAKPGQGRFFVATLSNAVYALDETTGAVIWMHSIGMGGHGIIGSPVIDAGTRAIFVAADPPGHHIIDALSIDTGDELPGWPVDVSKLSSGGVNFNSPDQNQRGALSLVGGTLYVPYGGYYGDGGNYRGWVVAVDVKNPANAAGWATSGQQEGIWAPGGLASDGNGVFAVTGNNGSAPETHLDSEEVVRVTGLAEAQRDDANRFWPTIWRTGMDMGDKDFGSCSPLVIMATGGTPASLVVAPAKPGHVYRLPRRQEPGRPRRAGGGPRRRGHGRRGRSTSRPRRTPRRRACTSSSARPSAPSAPTARRTASSSASSSTCRPSPSRRRSCGAPRRRATTTSAVGRRSRRRPTGTRTRSCGS